LALLASSARFASPVAAQDDAAGEDILSVLNYALTLEHLENAFYRDGLAVFTVDAFTALGFQPSVLDYVVQIGSDELAHVETLTQVITDLGGTPVAEGEYDFAAAYADLPTCLATGMALEDTGVGAYTGAAQYLIENDVDSRNFNSFGSRRGNHQVMVRGTFGNIRLRNQLVEKEGGYTIHLPDGEETTIYEASLKYADEGVPLMVLAGKEYGSGSSRDWAAKGSFLLGVKAVIAESFERIHRSNLVGMGVLPLQYADGENAESLGLTGKESFDIGGLSGLESGQELTVKATSDDGETQEFTVKTRVDSPVEIEYLRNGGILQTVLRQLLKEDE